MASSIDILNLVPQIAAIGQQGLQVYCNEWARRPIAREFGLVQLVVDAQLRLYISIDPTSTQFIDHRAYMPIDELLGYIVDKHFQDYDERHRLHAIIRASKKQFKGGSDYAANLVRIGTLYLTCKNSQCRAVMETDQVACETDRITYGPIDIECLTCGQIYSYDGRDLRLKIAK